MSHILLADRASKMPYEYDEIARYSARIVGIDAAEAVGAAFGIEDRHFACDFKLGGRRERVG